MPKYSVVIPSLANEVTKPYLRLTVESLRESGFNGQIVVVTNGSSNKPALNDIKGITKHIHIAMQGQCIATNYGVQVAAPDSDYILVSNDDMFYAKGWDLNLQRDFPDYPVFSPVLIEPTDNLGSAAPFLKLDGGYTIDKFNKEAVETFVNNEVMKPDHEHEPGFNLPFFIRKGLWDFLKGYDVAYDPFGSNSDTDLQTRINLAGITPMRLRDVLVYHFSNKSGTFSPENDAFRMNNFDYFKSKFGFDRDELGSDVWYNKDMLPADPEKIKYKQAKYDV